MPRHCHLARHVNRKTQANANLIKAKLSDKMRGDMKAIVGQTRKIVGRVADQLATHLWQPELDVQHVGLQQRIDRSNDVPCPRCMPTRKQQETKSLNIFEIESVLEGSRQTLIDRI